MTSPSDSGPAGRQGHPGRGRGKGRYLARGRPVEPAALEEVRALLGERPRRADLLIEHLHLIQDRFGHLSAAHLAALAEEMRLAQAEVYEVATFYAHFDVVREGEAPPPAVTVRVCDGLPCALAGAEALLADLARALGAEARVVRAPCVGRCECAPVAVAGHNPLEHATAEAVLAAVAARDLAAPMPAAPDLASYRADGGYQLLEACLAGRLSAEALIEAVEASALRGLGGAGFPVGRKWRAVRAQPAPRLLAVNADEGEPGTFKDRYCLETAPHRVLEGMLVAAWAVGAEAAYIYLRDEYPGLRALLEAALAEVAAAGLDRGLRIELRRGAGAYICGEESAMLESIEGRRGLPRHKPPFPSEVGLFARPTLIQNVETLYWLPEILDRGPDWFAGEGLNGAKGLRLFSVSGRVREAGVKRAPAGITARDLIDEHCGGIAPGHAFKAYLPGGASGGILPASLADLPLDFGTLDAHGCFVGSGAVIVLGEADSIAAAVLNLMRFFEDESCGQCTPCRLGTEKAAKLLAREAWDVPLIEELCRVMADASICGLGQAAPNPLRSALRHFRAELPA